MQAMNAMGQREFPRQMRRAKKGVRQVGRWPGRLAACVLAVAAGSAGAHDTWFAVRSAQLPGNALLSLGTGNLFPVQEFAVASEHLDRSGCRQGSREVALTAVAAASTALLLRAQPGSAQPLTCWAQLVPFEIEIEPPKVALYLDEINASPALRATWSAMLARGLPWKEQYVKHARVEMAAVGVGAASAAAARQLPAVQAAPTPMAMDVVLQSGPQPLRPGDRLVFQVLRDGLPLANFPVELRGETAAGARWLQTDADGRVSTPAPAAGAWVLRGTDLRLSTTDPTLWQSRFVTLAFRIHPAP